jgi:hypothetical protein
MTWMDIWVNRQLPFQPMVAGRVRLTRRSKKWIKARGMIPVAVTNIPQNAIENKKKIHELVALVSDSIKV